MNHYFEVAAHRGNMSAFPENTMEAFESAIAANCHWIELDIQETKDKHLVVTHDASTLRVAGENKLIASSSYKELLELNFGYYFDKNKKYQLPKLSEVLELVRIKSTRISIQPKQNGLIKPAYQLAKQMNLLSQIGFNDTNCEYLIEAKNIDATIPVFWDRPPQTDLDTDLFIASKFNFNTLMYEWQGITDDKIAKVKACNIRMGASVINEEKEMKKWINAGIEHFYTDYPLTLLDLK